MTTHDTVLLPSNLGSAQNYDPTVLVRFTGKDSYSFREGRLYLRATLDEIIKIRSLSRSFDGDHYKRFIQDAKSQYDNLLQQQKELESYEKRNWLYKLLKPKVKRNLRAFCNDAFELWDSTTTTSDSMKRFMLSTLSTNFAPVNSESVSNDEQVSGLAVDVDRPVTQEAVAAVQKAASVLASVNVPSNSIPPDSQDGQTSATGVTSVAGELPSARSSLSTSPSSSSSSSSFGHLSINFTIVNNVNSSTPGFTINNASESSGSTVGASTSS